MVGKLWFPAFQNFFRTENPLNIKEVINQNVKQCRHCRYKHRISNASNAMDVDTVDTNKKKENTLDFFINLCQYCQYKFELHCAS